jgi:hypothetical protein
MPGPPRRRLPGRATDTPLLAAGTGRKTTRRRRRRNTARVVGLTTRAKRGKPLTAAGLPREATRATPTPMMRPTAQSSEHSPAHSLDKPTRASPSQPALAGETG